MRVDLQIGLEQTPEEYVASLVAVFREVWRVLRDDGTLWLNLGDSYTAQGDGAQGKSGQRADRRHTQITLRGDGGLRHKQLVGIPWRVAFALQADGWYLRSDIIWAKPNPMPESVTDRPTKAHEYLFLLAKSARYYYDHEAIAEDAVQIRDGRPHNRVRNVGGRVDGFTRGEGGAGFNIGSETRNKRSVWTVTTEPNPDAHFATFPEALIKPCILAGCPLGGLVLDPFIGSGTTGAVASRLGRRWVGVDLTYQHLAKVRTAQRGLPLVEDEETA